MSIFPRTQQPMPQPPRPQWGYYCPCCDERARLFQPPPRPPQCPRGHGEMWTEEVVR